ncbi:hypothetical protein [Metabacillus fastidiosus]|uniref:hypothetical protein n=1 Tax=Metabacillus fastidiosus TaxID=1458 RepID=UPI003D27BBD1
MLKNWIKYGFGHMPNQEEDEIVTYFEEVTGFEITYKARRVLQTLIGKYGVIKVTRMINELKADTDKSLILILHLQIIVIHYLLYRQKECLYNI